jgi:hypothetical protein
MHHTCPIFCPCQKFERRIAAVYVIGRSWTRWWRNDWASIDQMRMVVCRRFLTLVNQWKDHCGVESSPSPPRHSAWQISVSGSLHYRPAIGKLAHRVSITFTRQQTASTLTNGFSATLLDVALFSNLAPAVTLLTCILGFSVRISAKTTSIKVFREISEFRSGTLCLFLNSLSHSIQPFCSRTPRRNLSSTLYNSSHTQPVAYIQNSVLNNII